MWQSLYANSFEERRKKRRKKEDEWKTMHLQQILAYSVVTLIAIIRICCLYTDSLCVCLIGMFYFLLIRFAVNASTLSRTWLNGLCVCVPWYNVLLNCEQRKNLNEI